MLVILVLLNGLLDHLVQQQIEQRVLEKYAYVLSSRELDEKVDGSCLCFESGAGAGAGSA